MNPEATAVRRHLPPGTPAYTVGIGCSRLPAAPPPPAGGVVLLVGVAGALDPTLAVGDLVLDDPAGLLASLSIRRGVVHTAGRIVATPPDKAALFAATGAAVADMEQTAVRAWADRHGARFVGLRAVSDTAAQTLDPVIVRLVTDVGRPRPMAIAATLIRRPSLIPHLRRLGADTAVALARLGPAAREVVDALTR